MATRVIDEPRSRVHLSGRADREKHVTIRRVEARVHDLRIQHLAEPHDTGPERAAAVRTWRAAGSGTASCRRASDAAAAAQPRQQPTSQIEPCSRRTPAVPARSCRPSTFCVISLNSGEAQAPVGQHVVREVRLAGGDELAPPVVPLPDRARDRARTPAGVASSSTRKCFQRPSVPRNVGTPLAAETPAPVSTVTRRAPASAATTSA